MMTTIRQAWASLRIRALAARARVPLPAGLLRAMALVSALLALVAIVASSCYPDGVIR